MSQQGREVVIVEAVRTPIGRRNGALGDLHPVDLSAAVLTEVVERTGLVPDETIVEVGDPVSTIIDAAITHDVDLIVVGAHDKGFLQRVFTGSVSQDVVRNAPTPVLVVGEHTRGA